MTRKIILIILCLNLVNCGGASYVSGLKFEKDLILKSGGGNPNSIEDVVKLKNNVFIGFKRPIGKCGAKITFFGILIPIIPVNYNINSCNKEFFVSTESEELLILKIKYSHKIIKPYSTKNVTKNGYRKEFYFKIKNFSEFKRAKNKAIIATGKTKDGKEFTEELPVKWGVMQYYNWSFP